MSHTFLVHIRYPKHQLSQRSYIFSCNIISSLRKLPKDSISVVLSNQLIRCGTSIGANIVEAQACSTRKDFAHFYNHALKSANESKFWLFLIQDSLFYTSKEIEDLIRESSEIANILGAILKKLRSKK